jgi:hypothetical protein
VCITKKCTIFRQDKTHSLSNIFLGLDSNIHNFTLFFACINFTITNPNIFVTFVLSCFPGDEQKSLISRSQLIVHSDGFCELEGLLAAGGEFFFQHTKRDRGPGGAEPVALGQSKRDTATAAPRQALEIFETNTYRQLNELENP